jgi:hypothetical protein
MNKDYQLLHDYVVSSMSFWQTMKSLPLEDNRDILARIGMRCVCCTLPYFVFVYALNAFGFESPLTSPMSMWIVAIPIIGGVVDWFRIHRQSVRSAAE